MDRTELATTGRSTTKLGFGCSGLMGGTSRRESLALLESAFDAGIRHFDVAPMYGYGEAEGCLGEFLGQHPGQCTVTTKYGIPATKSPPLVRIARKILGPHNRKLPSIKKRLARFAGSITQLTTKSAFTAAAAKASLESSLTRLKISRIDLWLLHEVTSADLSDDTLLCFLKDSVANGTIGAFGVGSETTHIDALIAMHPEYCGVVQHEWSVLRVAMPQTTYFRIHHRALTERFAFFHAALQKNAERCLRWSNQTGYDLSDAATLARLMLKASLIMNPAGITLFSSRQPQHIQANVAVSSDAAWAAPALKLYELVQREEFTGWLLRAGV